MVYLFCLLHFTFEVNIEPVPKKQEALSLRKKIPLEVLTTCKVHMKLPPEIKENRPSTPAGIPVLRIVFCY